MNSYKRPGMFGGFSLFPPVIKLLLISNVAIYVIFNLLLSGFSVDGTSFESIILKYFALNPLEPVLIKDLSGDVIKIGFYPWQLVTYMFLHGDFFHLLFNMFALWMFGVELENTWGSKTFLIYYMVCGVGAGLCNLLIAPLFTSTGPTVGASGAIYGILVAFAYLFPNRVIYFWGIFPIKAKYLVILFMVIELFSSVGGRDSVAHVAHLGGGFVGLIYLLLFYKGSSMKFFNNPGFKDKFSSYTSSSKRTYSPPVYSNGTNTKKEDVSDAKYQDLGVTDYKKEIELQEKQAQQKIDAILDKLSEGGYQSLSEEEKRILFQESKKLR